MQCEINRFAEFKDEKIEKQFHDDEVQKGLRLSRNMIIIFAVVNFLFVFLDYYFLQYSDVTVVIYYSLIPRAIMLACAVFVFFLLKRAKNKSAAISSVIAFVILQYLLHEYTAMHFAPVDLVFEVLDLVLITYGLFLIPNRWITNVCTSALLSVIFLVLTPFTIPTMTIGTKVPLILYLVAQVFLLALLIYRNQTQKRRNYLQHLQLETLAKTDVLTKAFNRVACDMYLEQMCASQCDFSLIMVDLDDFKEINDTCGHLTGDNVIVKTVEIIKTNVGQDDIVARWGGEEFIIIQPSVSLDRAAETAKRIISHLSTIEFSSTIGKVTASFGATAFIKGDDTNSIINRADQLLYQAKQQGKNKVVFG